MGQLIPFKIAREITASFSDNFIPLTPIDDLPEKTLKSLQENLIHFPSLVERKISSVFVFIVILSDWNNIWFWFSRLGVPSSDKL